MKLELINHVIYSRVANKQTRDFPDIPIEQPIFRTIRDYFPFDIDNFRHEQSEPMDDLDVIDALYIDDTSNLAPGANLDKPDNPSVETEQSENDDVEENDGNNQSN